MPVGLFLGSQVNKFNSHPPGAPLGGPAIGGHGVHRKVSRLLAFRLHRGEKIDTLTRIQTVLQKEAKTSGRNVIGCRGKPGFLPQMGYDALVDGDRDVCATGCGSALFHWGALLPLMIAPVRAPVSAFVSFSTAKALLSR